MDEPFALQRILQQMLRDGGDHWKLPPCPGCERRVKVGFEIQKNGSPPGSAAIWLWCSSCTQVAVAFGVTPPPAWLGGPKEEIESGGG